MFVNLTSTMTRGQMGDLLFATGPAIVVLPDGRFGALRGVDRDGPSGRVFTLRVAVGDAVVTQTVLIAD